jgi:hypothetical protein
LLPLLISSTLRGQLARLLRPGTRRRRPVRRARRKRRPLQAARPLQAGRPLQGGPAEATASSSDWNKIIEREEADKKKAAEAKGVKPGKESDVKEKEEW